MRFFASVSLLVALAFANHGVTAQTVTPSADACSNLKLEISSPEDTVKPPSEFLLAVKLTNVGREGFWLSGDWWSYDFDLRNANGDPVPKTAKWLRALHDRPTDVTLNVARPLAPGASEIQNLMLEKLFDLSHPGEYTIRVSNFPGCPSVRSSNLLHFTIPSALNHPRASKPAITIHAATPLLHVPSGWAVPIDIVVSNVSKHPLKWAVTYSGNSAPDEFGMGIRVFDAAGKPLPPPEHPNPDWDFHFPHGSIDMLALAPGKQAEQIIAMGNLFDLSRPGHYTARVALLDPETNTPIESNPVPFEIGGEINTTKSPLPPFIVTLRSSPVHTSSGHLDDSSSHIDPSGVLICMSNISDHDIRLDNASSKDYEHIDGPDGKPATMTEAAQKAWHFIDPENVTAGQEMYSTWWTVKPRKALCGGIYAEPTFVLSRPGAYRIRIDRYDEPDATPGEKFADLPVVHSNWLTFIEPASR